MSNNSCKIYVITPNYARKYFLFSCYSAKKSNVNKISPFKFCSGSAEGCTLLWLFFILPNLKLRDSWVDGYLLLWWCGYWVWCLWEPLGLSSLWLDWSQLNLGTIPVPVRCLIVRFHEVSISWEFHSEQFYHSEMWQAFPWLEYYFLPFHHHLNWGEISSYSANDPLDILLTFISHGLIFLAATKHIFLSVRPTVCHTFSTVFLSSYHHEIFRSYYHSQMWSPRKRSRSEVKGQGHRGQNPI